MKAHTVGVGLHHVIEAEELKPARIGQHGTVVVHELLHAPRALDDVNTGTHIEMVRVRKHDLATQVVQLVDGHTFDRGMRADRHEHGGMHRAMGGIERQRARIAVTCINGHVEKRHWRFPFTK